MLSLKLNSHITKAQIPFLNIQLSQSTNQAVPTTWLNGKLRVCSLLVACRFLTIAGYCLAC